MKEQPPKKTGFIVILSLGIVCVLTAIEEAFYGSWAGLIVCGLVGGGAVWLGLRFRHDYYTALDDIARQKREAREERERQEREAREERERRAQEARQERINAKIRLDRAYADMFNSILAVDIDVADTPAGHLNYDWVEGIKIEKITSSQLLERLGRYVVVDVETTGLSAAQSEIIQVAAVRFRNFVPTEKFVTYCAPNNGLSAEAAAVNGITADMLEGKPSFGEIAKSLEAFIGNDAIVGQKVRFDLKFIAKYGVDLEHKNIKYYDTIDLAKALRVCDLENYKLPTLCKAFGVYLGREHDAEADAVATGQLFEVLARLLNDPER
nr:MAG TPA: DNA polymerase III subunit alpha [Caudoviricetes sp.]